MQDIVVGIFKFFCIQRGVYNQPKVLDIGPQQNNCGHLKMPTHIIILISLNNRIQRRLILSENKYIIILYVIHITHIIYYIIVYNLLARIQYC